MRKTKIIATLGPAVSSEEKIAMLIEAGVDVFRLNAAHGHVEEHVELMNLARKVSEEKREVGIMLDIKGPEMRVSEARIRFAKDGDEVSIGLGGDIEINRPEAYGVIREGTRILIHDGEIEIKILKKRGELAYGKVVRGGIIAPHMGVNIPGVHVPLDYIQRRDLEFMENMKDVDFIAASFVRSAGDIISLRREMKRMGMDAKIIAKIENGEGVENIDAILEVSDGIMVARGDLGTEIPVENLPAIQKELVRKAMEHGKPSIIATQILETMIRNPQPTRAEVSDIANSILDGADALMLSGETAIGKYPVEAVNVLAKVAEKAEEMVTHRNMEELKGTISECVSNAAVLLAKEVNADAILLLTRSGKTARLISRHRIPMPVIAATYSERTLREMSLLWGVRGFLVEKFDYADDAVKKAINTAESLKMVKRGDLLVVAGGEPSGIPGTTNFVWVQLVGELIARGEGYGEQKIRGRACSDGSCEIIVVDELTEEIKNAKGIIVKSRIYDPELLKELASEGIAIVAGVGDVKIEGEINIDPMRGLIWR